MQRDWDFLFIDVDIVIQEKEGRLLKEIIADEGMDGFLEVENRINAGLEAKMSLSPQAAALFTAKRLWII